MNKCPQCHKLKCEYIGDDYWMCSNCDYEKGSAEYFLEARDAKVEQLEKDLAGIKHLLELEKEWSQNDGNVIEQFAKVLEERNKEIRELKEANRWQKRYIDSPPNDSGWYLVRCEYFDDVKIYMRNYIKERGNWNTSIGEKVTHWRPLPELPVVEGGSND